MRTHINIKGKQNTVSKLMAAGVVVLLATAFFACNTSFPNLLQKEYGNDTAGITSQNRNVLYIMVDGGRGLAVQNANMPNLSQMAKHAIYTWDGIADYKNAGNNFTDANGWANMLTGVTQDKHKIDSTFSGNDLTDYPTFITRLKTIDPSWKTVALCASDNLQKNLLSNATESKSFNGDDDEVEKATVDELNGNDDARVIIAEFHGAEVAGEQYGYDTSSQQYLEALSTIDRYIGDILSALISRKNYAHEKWLVVVASNKGGLATTATVDLTAFGDTRRNNFIMFYNPKFDAFYAPKPQNTSGAGPYIGKAVHLFGDPDDANVGGVNIKVQNKQGESDQSIFDVGTGSLTVEAKVKFLPRPDQYGYAYYYPPFLSKTNSRYGSTAGWCLYRNGNTITAYVATGSQKIEVNGGNVANGDWHTVGLEIHHEGNTYLVKLYIDGILIGHSQASFTAGTTVASPAPVTFGYNSTVFTDDYVSMYMTDVRIWKAALPDEVVAQYACYPGMPPSTHPYFNDLVGFWTCREGQGDTCYDFTGGGHDAIVNAQGGANVSWDPFHDVSQNICPAPSDAYYQLVPNSVDIPFEIFQWLGINIPSSWGWDGHGWVTGYTDVANPVY